MNIPLLTTEADSWWRICVGGAYVFFKHTSFYSKIIIYITRVFSLVNQPPIHDRNVDK